MAKIREREFEWASMDDVRSTFEQLIRTSSGICNWIKGNKPRNDDSLTPFNFLACSVTYLEITRNTIPAPIQVVRQRLSSRSTERLRARKA
jgi:hypothetical protein